MLITSPKYYFRYTTRSKCPQTSSWAIKDSGTRSLTLVGFLESKEAIDLFKLGCSVIEWAPYTTNNQTRVKPQHVLYVDRPHTKTAMHQLIANLSWTLDLRTVNLDDYPEFFI